MADWSSADHGRTTQRPVRRIPTQTAETLEYDSQGLAQDRMLERQRRWQPVNKTRRRNHIFGVTAVAANDTDFRARCTTDGIFVSARITFSTALDAFHNDRIIFGEFRHSSAGCDNDSGEFMPRNNRIFGDSALVITEPALKNFEIRGADTRVGHSHQNFTRFQLGDAETLNDRFPRRLYRNGSIRLIKQELFPESWVLH